MKKIIISSILVALSTTSSYAQNIKWPNTQKCTSTIKNQSIEILKQHSPEGYSIYNRGKTSYLDNAWWYDCYNVKDNIIVAVHETVHDITTRTDTYPLINGKNIPVVLGNNLFRPALNLKLFKSDRFTELYLVTIPNSMSSATNFSILLDEFNAYTYGLHVANKLSSKKEEHQWRDGAVALMSYVKAYLDKAKQEYPKAWKELNSSKLKYNIVTLWKQAETVILNSCQFKSSSNDDVQYIRYLCNSKPDAVKELIGNTFCPRHCLR